MCCTRYICETESGVMCVDFHPEHPNYIAVGFYDGKCPCLGIFAQFRPVHTTVRRVFVWGWRPDVSSGRFPFHVRYFDFNICGSFYFIIITCFYLSISWIYWLENNRILQIKFFKTATLLFFFAYRVEYLTGFRFISTKLKWPFRFHSCSAKAGESEIPRQNTLHVLVEQKTRKRILPFVTEYRPSVPNLKNIRMSKWHLIENQPLLKEIYTDLPLPAFIQKRQVFRKHTR